jgi:dolichyl-phosphate beta-glucosyltransferase
MKSLTIIIPCYNEEKRLPKTFNLLKKSIDSGNFSGINLKTIMIVDDGSKDNTVNLATNEKDLPITLIKVGINQGKGNAVYTGLKAAETDLCLIADADSATSWSDFKKLLNENNQGFSIVIGSRKLEDSVVESNIIFSQIMSKVFSALVKLITGLNFKDTQCGFKLIDRKSIQNVLPNLIVKRFAWDVEFLMFTKHLPTKEVGVNWVDIEGSTVSPIKDSFEMLKRILEIRLRLMKKKLGLRLIPPQV